MRPILTRPSAPTRLARLAPALLLGVLALSACASGSGDAASDPSSAAGAASGNPNADAAAEERPFSGEAASAELATTGVVEGDRRVISTADVLVSVEDAAAAGDRAVAAAERSGGLVFSEASDFSRSEAQVVITLKVPPDEFRPVLDELAGLGELQNQDVGTEDVTEQVVDLESRIATAEVSVDRLRGFLSSAETVEQISSLERELLTRETDLEGLQGQLRALEERVDLATITATFTEEIPEPEPEPASLPTFLDGLSGTLEALGTVGRVGLVVAGALVPLVPFVALGWAATVLFRRRRAASSTSAASAT